MIKQRGWPRWCRFTLRRLLLGITLCSVLLAISSWRAAQLRRQAYVVGHVQSLGGSVLHRVVPKWKRFWEWNTVWSVNLEGSQADSKDLRLLRALVGIERLKLSDTEIEPGSLAALTPLTSLDLLNASGTRITDEDLKHLAALQKLTFLDLERTSVTDAGIAHIGGLPALQELNLQGTQVTDAALARLRSAPMLRVLLLDERHITPVAVDHLKEIKSLEQLHVHIPSGTGRAAWQLLTGLSEVKFTGHSGPENHAVWDAAIPWETSTAGMVERIATGAELTNAKAERLLEILRQVRPSGDWAQHSLPLTPSTSKPPEMPGETRIRNVDEYLETLRNPSANDYWRRREFAGSAPRETIIPKLIGLLDSSTSPSEIQLRISIIRELAHVGHGDERVLRTFEDALHNNRLRYAAADSLPRILAPDDERWAFDVLMPFENDPDPSIRLRIAQGLVRTAANRPEQARETYDVLSRMLQRRDRLMGATLESIAKLAIAHPALADAAENLIVSELGLESRAANALAALMAFSPEQ